MKPQDLPLATYLLKKFKTLKQDCVQLTLYDLCALVPFASEARIRFAVRQLMKQGHAVPFVRVPDLPEDTRAMFGWTITTEPYMLSSSRLGRELLSDKPAW